MEIKAGRIKGLQNAAVRLREAEKAKMGYDQCYYIGVIRRMKDLLIHEDGMTREEVDNIEKRQEKRPAKSKPHLTALYCSTNFSIAL